MDKECAVVNCIRLKRHSGSKYCDMHYRRVLKYGKTGPAHAINKLPDKLCEVEGCIRKIQRNPDYCLMHYQRIRKGREIGSPFRLIREKGDGSINKFSGYKIICKPGHPMARGVKGTIYEHRFVMSEYLNRPLLPTEWVHHRNGNKADNRIENLELWVTSQPPGQRPEDLIQYAEEILKQYAPHKLVEQLKENNNG